ncbi:MAG TPA: hypothetical protein VF707_14445, partial [Ardenticatenaceae bacterium]
KSPIYIDLRLLASHPRVLNLVARAYAELLTDGTLEYDLIAPLPYAALPIGTAVSLQTGDPMIYPRKETKEYGTKRNIEGSFAAGQIAVMLDDLISTGGTKVQSVQPLRDAGLQVSDILVLIDRSGGRGRAELAEHGLLLHSVMTLETMLDHLATRRLISRAQKQEVERFLAES